MEIFQKNKSLKVLPSIIVEGNISSGKTTFLEELRKGNTHLTRRAQIIGEPLDIWQNLRGINYLDLFYKDPKKNGFNFESLAYLTILKNQTKKLEFGKSVRVLERSLNSTYNIFVENLRNEGILDNSQYVILSEWYHYLNQSQLYSDKYIIIYLEAPTLVLQKRIIERGRTEEEKIKLSYLDNIQSLYRSWIDIEARKGTKVLIVNTDRDLEQTKEDFKCVINKLNSIVFESRVYGEFVAGSSTEAEPKGYLSMGKQYASSK